MWQPRQIADAAFAEISANAGKRGDMNGRVGQAECASRVQGERHIELIEVSRARIEPTGCKDLKFGDIFERKIQHRSAVLRG